MNVRQLHEALDGLPDDLEVWRSTEKQSRTIKADGSTLVRVNRASPVTVTNYSTINISKRVVILL